MKATTRSLQGAVAAGAESVMAAQLERGLGRLAAGARNHLRGDACHVFSLIAAHFELQFRRHARFAAGAGHATRAIGCSAGDLAHGRKILKCVGQTDDNHAVVEQGAVKRGDRGLLAAVLAGGAAKTLPILPTSAPDPQRAGFPRNRRHAARSASHGGGRRRRPLRCAIPRGRRRLRMAGRATAPPGAPRAPYLDDDVPVQHVNTSEEGAAGSGPDETVRMYTCGLTVYARGHIGNFRTFVCLDVLRRTLKSPAAATTCAR